MGPPNRPKTRLPLTLSPDGFAYFASVEIDSSPRTLLVDTSSAAGILLACTSFPADGAAKDACLKKAKSSDLCPPNSEFAYTPLWGTSFCRVKAPPRVELKLADLTLPSVPPSVLTSDTSQLFHGADGALGLALRSTYTKRSVNLTDQIESFSLHLAGKEPYLVLNDADAGAHTTDEWTALRQAESFMNESTIEMQGFRESVNESFVTTRTTTRTSTEFSTVNAELDVAWPSLVFPTDHFNTFYAKYLTSCTPHSETSAYDTPRYYHCDRSVKLPRLAFTTTNGTFFLDHADYVIDDPEDAARAIVLVQNFTIRKYAAFQWGLGQPFLRKFPAFFDATGKRHQITLYCKPDISCDLSKWVVNGSRESITYPPATYLPRSGTKSSETHTRLLSGPNTLTVDTSSNGSAAVPAIGMPAATGANARWRSDLADLETRV